MKRNKLTLEQMVKFVRQVAEVALAEKRPFDAGVLVQASDYRLCVLMTPTVSSEEEVELALGITDFLEEHAAFSYVYMTKLNKRTRDIFIYAADREGERITKRLKVDKGQLSELPHEGVHRFLELFPRTFH